MPLYLHLGRFTEQGVKNLREMPKAVRQSFADAEKQGVKLHGYYVTEGQYDFAAIVETPDEQTGLRGLLGVVSEGNIRTETLRAHTLDEIEQITQTLG
jgi:uncharacterized protein with GYD domain